MSEDTLETLSRLVPLLGRTQYLESAMGLTCFIFRFLRRPRFVLLKRRHELTDAEYMRFSGWTLNYPEIGQAYELKETFFEIWDCKTRHQAQEAYYAWLRQVTPDMKAHFDPLIKAMGNWHDDIFAYFNHSITNAYTESLNNLIRVMNRVGRGYSFEALRAKILFTEGFQKIKKPRYQRKRIPEEAMGRMRFYGFAETGQSTNYGADISTLVQEIEAGHL